MAISGFKRSVLLILAMCLFVLLYLLARDDHDVIGYYDDVLGAHPRGRVHFSKKPTMGRLKELVRVYDLSTVEDTDCERYYLDGEQDWSMCVFSFIEDPIVTAHVTLSGTWEPEALVIMKHQLLNDKDLGLLDLGSNLGVYSLTTASLGRKVLAVEPYKECNNLMAESLVTAKFQDRVTLLEVAVGDMQGFGRLHVNNSFKSNTTVEQVVGISVDSPPVIDGFTYTGLITLDDLLPFCEFEKAILKVDVQGYEHRVFAHAREFFDAVEVPLILMEWSHCASMLRNDVKRTTADLTMIHEMVALLLALEYKPWSCSDNRLLDVEQWLSWPSDIYWSKAVNHTHHRDLK